MRVYVDKLGCTGAALCAEMVPDVFAIDKDGLATVRDDTHGVQPDGGAPRGLNVPERLQSAVRDAAEICPGRCIVCSDR
jgi:ferredoxin